MAKSKELVKVYILSKEPAFSQKVHSALEQSNAGLKTRKLDVTKLTSARNAFDRLDPANLNILIINYDPELTREIREHPDETFFDLNVILCIPENQERAQLTMSGIKEYVVHEKDSIPALEEKIRLIAREDKVDKTWASANYWFAGAATLMIIIIIIIFSVR